MSLLRSVARILTAPVRIPLRLVRRVVRRLAHAISGDLHRLRFRLGLACVFLVGAVSTTGLFFLLIQGSSASGRSGPLLRWIVDNIATNFLLWQLLFVLAFIRSVQILGRRQAGITAEQTRFSTRTVRRLAKEVATLDGTNRLIGRPSDSMDQLEAKLRTSLMPETEGTSEWVASGETDREGAVEARSPEQRALDTGIEGRLTDGHSEGPVPAAAVDDPTPHEGQSEATLPATVDDSTGETNDGAREETTTVAQGTAAPAAADSGAGDQSDPDRSLRELVRTLRLDLATALSTREFKYSFFLPAIVTGGLIAVLARSIWFQLWVYPVIVGICAATGGIYYLWKKWWRKRSLKKLRRTDTSDPWHVCGCLVKRVETPEATAYIAFMAGRTYYDTDRDRFVAKVADRWHQRLTEGRVAPAIQEKWAREVRHHKPMIEQHLRNDEWDGLPAIQHALVKEVRTADDPDGMVMKRELARRVVKSDDGVGFDPDLVAEVYRDLVPLALHEIDVEIEDESGDPVTVTMVHERDRAVPESRAKIRAKYSGNVQAHKQGKWELPDVNVMSTHIATPETASSSG